MQALSVWTFLLLLIAGLTSANSATRPTDEVAKKAIAATVRSSPTKQAWCGIYQVQPVESVALEQWAQYNERERYWPVKATIVGICADEFTGVRQRFEGKAGFELRENDFGEWSARQQPGQMTIGRQPQTRVAPPDIVGNSPSVGQPAAPTVPQQQALATPTQSVDPAAKAILAGGFAGLRVGHTRTDAERFFGQPLREIKLCGNTLQNRTFLETTSGDPVQVMLWRDQVVALRVSTGAYMTRSGLRVGDEQAKILQIYGRDPTFEKRNEVTDSHSTTPGVSLNYVGLGQNYTLLAIVIDNKVSSLVFGAGTYVPQLEDRCFRKAR